MNLTLEQKKRYYHKVKVDNFKASCKLEGIDLDNLVKQEIIELLNGKNSQYRSPFSRGMEDAANGVPWTACPFVEIYEDYERAEWLRGHSVKGHFK